MNNEGLLPHEAVLCGRCATACDPDDNFCRNCGLSLLGDAQLPALRQSALPAVWRPPLPVPVLKGAAYIAAGTVAEILVRRLLRNAFGRGRADTPSRAIEKANGHAEEDTHMMSETYLLRRVRFRR